MSAALTGYWQDFINQMIASGRFNNRSEVIRAGLRSLEERELAKELQEFDKVFAGGRSGEPDGKTIIDVVPYLGFMNITFVVICLTVVGVTYGKVNAKIAAWMFLTLSFTCLFVPAIGLMGYGKLPF